MGRCRIEVVDSGPGPALDLADVLYEPFVTSKRREWGSAWHLARQVALDHDGRLLWSRPAGRPFSHSPFPGWPDTRGARMSRILIVDDEASICWRFASRWATLVIMWRSPPQPRTGYESLDQTLSTW